MWFLFVGELTHALRPKMFIPCRCIFLFGIAFVGEKRFTKKIEQKSIVESQQKKRVLLWLKEGVLILAHQMGGFKPTASTTFPASAKCGDTVQPPHGEKKRRLNNDSGFQRRPHCKKKLGEEPFLLTFTKRLIFDSDLGKPVPGGKPQVPKVPQ